MSKLENLLPLVVHDPNVLLGIVGINLDLVRPASAGEKMIPLRPRLNHFAAAVEDVDSVGHPRFRPRGRYWHAWKLEKRELRSARRVDRSCSSRHGFFLRHFAARQDDDAIRCFGEHSGLRSPSPSWMIERSWPVRDHFVRPGFAFTPLLLHKRGNGSHAERENP